MQRKMPDDEYHMSLQEIADELGVSRQVVWAIERRAISKIKHKLREWSDERQCDDNSDNGDDLLVLSSGNGWGLRGLEARGRELLRNAQALSEVEW
jgi:transcriptional regulator with XRE-family HTH domain